MTKIHVITNKKRRHQEYCPWELSLLWETYSLELLVFGICHLENRRSTWSFWIQKEMVLALPSSYGCPVPRTFTQETKRPVVPPYLDLEQCSVSYFPAILHFATGTFPWVNDREWFLSYQLLSAIMKWESLPGSFNSKDGEWPFLPFV